jgi:hypothetical protein
MASKSVARIRENKNAFKLLVGKPAVKRPLGRPKRSCVDNIEMDLREILERLDWSGSGQRPAERAFVRVVMNLRVPYLFWSRF